MGTGGCSTGKPQYELVNGPAAPVKVKEREKACTGGYSGGYPACPECMKDQGNPEVVKELLILGCWFIPVLGSGCDAYDVKRAADEDDKVGVAAGITAFLPLGDFLKLPKSLDRIADAAKTTCKCFLAGTKVLMVDESTRNIEDVEVGDTVLATDPETGETAPQKVTRLIETEDDKHFNELSIATHSGIEKLTATHEHPFWSPSENESRDRFELRPDPRTIRSQVIWERRRVAPP